MKKLFVVVLFFLMGVSLVAAQNLDNIVDTAEDIRDSTKDKEALSNFFEERWENFLENSSFGKTLVKTEEALSFLDPLFKWIIGLEFSWSAMFFLTILLWVTFVVCSVRILTIFTKNSKIINLLISFGVVVVISALGITRILSRVVLDIISSLPHWSIQLVASVIVLAIIVFIILYSGLIKRISRRGDLERKVEKVSREAKEAKREALGARKRKNNVSDEEIEEMAREGIEGLAYDEGI